MGFGIKNSEKKVLYMNNPKINEAISILREALGFYGGSIRTSEGSVFRTLFYKASDSLGFVLGWGRSK